MQTRNCLLLFASAVLLIVGFAVPGYAAPPPAPWKPKDVGPRITPGTVDTDPRGFWTVRAYNGDVALNADSFFFVSQPLAGDGSILAFLIGEQGGDPQFGKAGLMIRENDTPAAANVHLFMTSGRGVGISFRPIAKQPTVNEGAEGRYGGRAFPVWLRLQREGERFTPFSSPDGFGWTQLHSPITLPNFPTDALVGVSAASLVDGPVAAAFGNVTVSPGQNSPIVQVCSTNGAVLLTWPPVASALGYVVRRSAPNTPGFAADLLTPQPIKETSFADTGLTNGQPIRYLVSAVYDQGGQALEGWATAVPALPVPTPGNLYGCDINLEATQLRGGILFDPGSGTYKISGAGGDIWNTEDRCFYAFQLMKGDFQVTTKILDRAPRSGLMVRESLDGASRNAFLASTLVSGLVFQYREETGGATAMAGKPVIASADLKPPTFLRLVRRGSTITPLLSSDGTTFTPAGGPKTFDPPLPESLYMGYAITSMNTGAVVTSTFSDFVFGPPSQ